MPLADHQLTLEHEKLLWDTKDLDLNSSKGLLQAVIFYLIKCFAIWQGKELRQLQTYHISFGDDKLGKFVTLNLESSVFKRKRCVKRYDDPANPRSVYKILKKYRSRIPNEGPLILRPISSIKDFICYSPLPLGVKVIKCFISNLMEDAGIGQCFVNYSLNLHSIDTLRRFGTGFHCLSSWLLKNNIKSFTASPECSIKNCEDLNPEVTVMMSRLLDAPYPLDAVEILQEMEHEDEKQSREKDNLSPPKFDSWMTNLMKNSSSKNIQKDKQILESQRVIHSDVEKAENKSLSCCVSGCKINILSSNMNGELSPEEVKPQKDPCASEVESVKSSPRIMTVSSITEGAFSLQVDEGNHVFDKEGKGIDLDRHDETLLSSMVCGEKKEESEKCPIDLSVSKMPKNDPLIWERKEENEKNETDSIASKRGKNAGSNCNRKREKEKSEMDSLASKKRKKDFSNSQDKSKEISGKEVNCNKNFSYLKAILETNVNEKEINSKPRRVNGEGMELKSDKEMNMTEKGVSEISDIAKETIDKAENSTHFMQLIGPSQRNNFIHPSHDSSEDKTNKVTKENQPTMKNCLYKLPNPDTSQDSISILRTLLKNPSEEMKTSVDEKAIQNGEFDRQMCNENLTYQTTENMNESGNHMTNVLQTKKSEISENVSASWFDEETDSKAILLLMDSAPPSLSPHPPTAVLEKCDGRAETETQTFLGDQDDESHSNQCASNLVSADIVQFLDKANQQMKNILNASIIKNDSHKLSCEESSTRTSSRLSEQTSPSNIKIPSTHSRKSEMQPKVTNTSPVDEPSHREVSIAREEASDLKSQKLSEQSHPQFPLLRLFLEQPTKAKETDLASDSLSLYSTTLKSKDVSHTHIVSHSPTISETQKDSNELPKLTFMGHTCASSDNHGNKNAFQSRSETSEGIKTLTDCTSLSEKDSDCPQLVSSLSSSPPLLSLPASPFAALNPCTSNTAEYRIEKDLVNNAIYQSLLVNYEKDDDVRTFTFADIPIVSGGSPLSKRGVGIKQTSVINLGDYFPPGTLIPAKDIHLVTQQGPDGCDNVMKFKFSPKI